MVVYSHVWSILLILLILLSEIQIVIRIAVINNSLRREAVHPSLNEIVLLAKGKTAHTKRRHHVCHWLDLMREYVINVELFAKLLKSRHDNIFLRDLHPEFLDDIDIDQLGFI